jgi:predicted MFS family arabinose efflux permease
VTDAPTEAGHAKVLQTWRESSRTVKALVAGMFVHRLGGFLQVFVVLYLTHRGYSATEAGTALGAYGAGSILGVLTGGWLCDRFGARPTILGSMAAAAVLVVTILYLPSYAAVLAVVAAVGAAGQIYRPAAVTVIARLTPGDQQVMIAAMYRLALNLGTTAAPLLGVALVSASYDLLFWGEAAAMLGYAMVVGLALPRGRVLDAGHRDDVAGHHHHHHHHVAGHRDDDVERAPRGSGYLAVLADRRFLLFLFATFANAVIYVQYLAALPLSVPARGMSTAVYAFLVALNGAVVILCELPLTSVVQRWPPRVAVATGLALTGLGLSLYAPGWGVAGLAGATLLWTLGEIVSAPRMSIYPAQAGPPRLRGRYLAAAQAVFGLGYALGPVVGVAVWNRYGDAAWLYCLPVGVLTVLASWHGIRPGRRPDPSHRVAAD